MYTYTVCCKFEAHSLDTKSDFGNQFIDILCFSTAYLMFNKSENIPFSLNAINYFCNEHGGRETQIIISRNLFFIETSCFDSRIHKTSFCLLSHLFLISNFLYYTGWMFKCQFSSVVSTFCIFFRTLHAFVCIIFAFISNHWNTLYIILDYSP